MTPSTVSLATGLADFERPSSEMIRVTQEAASWDKPSANKPTDPVLFDGAGDTSFIEIGDCGVTKGNDDALARQPLGVAVGLDKLNKGCAFDKFGAEIHRHTLWHEKKENKAEA